MAGNHDPRRIVVITGCSSGIGRALAEEFASYNGERDFRVFATARNPESLRSLPCTIDRVPLDVTNEDSTKAAIASIIAQVGRIDVLVNNAGVNTGVGPAVEVELDRYRSTFEANYFGLIRVTQHVTPHMIQHRRGTIINIGSTAGLTPLPYAAAYASSKAAVHAYSETLRMELAGFGIKVTVVAPGAIRSSIGETGTKAISLAPNSNYKNVEDMIRYRAVYSQVGRPAPTPADVFAREVIRKCAVPRSPPAYLMAGSRSLIIRLLFYLPVWVRGWLFGLMFGLGRIGKGKA